MSNDLSPLEVSRAYWEAECTRDVDAIMAFYHRDGTYQDAGQYAVGHAAIRRCYEESVAAYPGLEVEIVREFRFSGADTDDTSAIEFDAYLIDADGRRHRVRGVNVVTVQDGKFVAVRSYEDAPSP